MSRRTVYKKRRDRMSRWKERRVIDVFHGEELVGMMLRHGRRRRKVRWQCFPFNHPDEEWRGHFEKDFQRAAVYMYRALGFKWVHELEFIVGQV